MKNIKRYDDFLNEELNFNFLKRRKKEEPKAEEPKVEITYEDDDIFDKLFDEIRNNFNYDNLSWEKGVYLDYSGWKYIHDGDELVIYGSGMRKIIPYLLVNKIQLDVNPKKVEELGKFFKEMDKNEDDIKHKDVKEKLTGNRDITDDELADFIFNEIKNTDIKVVLWKERNGRYGYGVDVADTFVHFINNRSDRGGTYPIDNMFIYDIGFRIDINKLEEISKFLGKISTESKNKVESEKRKTIRDKYLSR